MTWSAGAVLTAAQLNTYAPQAWTAYTPTCVNFPLTSVTGRYIQVGKTVFVRVVATASGAVSGTFTVSLPVTASSAFGTGGATFLDGTAVAYDQGVGYTSGMIALATTTTVQVVTVSTTPGGSAAWNATVPHTWASTDILTVAFTYEAA